MAASLLLVFQPASAAEKQIRINNFNTANVTGGPINPSRIQIKQRACVLELKTYHYNNAKGITSSTITLESDKGKIVGSWPTVGLPAKPSGVQAAIQNLFRQCQPDRVLEPGIYLIKDSDIATWSCNKQSGMRGFYSITLEPIPASDDTPLPENLNGSGIPSDLKSTNFTGSLTEYWEYYNIKHNFHVRYPSALIPQGESNDGDGQVFKAKDSSAELKTFGAFDPAVTLESELASTLKKKQEDAQTNNLKRIGDNWFILSGSKGPWLYYTKVIVDRPRVWTFNLWYSKERQSDYEPLVKKMAASFRLDPAYKNNSSAPSAVTILPPAQSSLPTPSAPDKPHDYKHYVSEEMKYCLDYPNDIFKREQGDNDAYSLNLTGKAKDVYLFTDVGEAVDGEDGHPLILEDMYKEESGYMPDSKLLKKEWGKDWYIVVRVDNYNVVTYKKQTIGKTSKNERFTKAFRLTYPVHSQAEFEAITRRMAESFHNLN
jgi:hypothetical protein